VKRIEIHYIYIKLACETHQILFAKKGREKKGCYGNIIEGANLFKAHCMHL
jgi:hypothetical protein